MLRKQKGKAMKKTLSVLIVMCLAFVAPADAGKYINEHLPEWVNVDVQLRHRYSWKDNADFDDGVDDGKGKHEWRGRLSIALMPMENLKLFYQLQDSRISHDSKLSTSVAGFQDFADTRQLYLQVTDIASFLNVDSNIDYGVRLGRQELSYGAQRLVGGFNWSNVAQTFDAGKVMLRFDDLDLTVDGFGGTKTPNNAPREADGFFDGSTHDLLAGYYATYKGVENMTIEQYLLHRKTNKNITYRPGTTGELDITTIGGRFKGKIADTHFDYELEGAAQFGDHNSLDVESKMAVAILGYTFDHDWKPRFAFEFDYGSGDTNSSDQTQGTFDNLFPTNHLHFGYMDLASLQNINNYRLQLTAKPTKKLAMQADLHFIFLDTAKDSLFNAGRSAKRTATGNGTGETHVGNELDLKAKYKVTKYANVLVGYSHFWAGDFLHESGSGAQDDGDYFYIQSLLNF